MVGPPERLHLDKDRNFESHILAELCKTFKITKFSILYYTLSPHGGWPDGADEQDTVKSLMYIYTRGGRLGGTPPTPFVYYTTKHSSTGLSPHEILFGYNPPSLFTPDSGLPELMNPVEYSDKLQKRFLSCRNGLTLILLSQQQDNRAHTTMGWLLCCWRNKRCLWATHPSQAGFPVDRTLDHA